MKKLLFTLFSMIVAINITNAQTSCYEHRTAILTQLLSIEDTAQNGTISYSLTIKASDSVYIDSINGDYSFFSTYSTN